VLFRSMNIQAVDGDGTPIDPNGDDPGINRRFRVSFDRFQRVKFRRSVENMSGLTRRPE